MLYLRIWMCSMVIFLSSISTSYGSNNIHVEKWEPCTEEFTILDMLSLLFFAEDNSLQKKKENPNFDSKELESSTDDNKPTIDNKK